MTGHIYPKTICGKVYYYYQESYREKMKEAGLGKTKGTGKSRVKSKSIYLGSAEQIFSSIKNNRKIPVEIKHRAFGLVAAAYQTAYEVGLIKILKKHITGMRYGIPRWIFFLLTIINRLDNATSKNKMCDWVKQTVLPNILQFDAKKISSKNYWYVTDDVISEEKTRENRTSNSETVEEDIFSGLDDKVFIDIEKELFLELRPHFGDNINTLIFDTSNFYTFFESDKYSNLAQTGHNKDHRHDCKQVGLAMAIESGAGIPFFHRVYRGNRHDAVVFSKVVNDMIDDIKTSFPRAKELVLVLDKGNNSEQNFKMLDGKAEWVGSLAPSQHKELVEIPLEKYDYTVGDYKAFCRTKTVMGKECLLVMTHNCALARKQEHTLQNGINKLIAKLKEKYLSYKNKPTKLTDGLKSILDASRYKNCVKISVKKGDLKILNNDDALAKRREMFGKNLLFTSKVNASVEWTIAQYKERNSIEDVFRTLKDVELIRIRPLRHFTDSKIRAHVFCCVMSFLLIRMMQLKADKADIKMSASVLKDELSDLQQVIMVYSDNSAEMKISQASTVQQKLSHVFQLEKIQNMLTIHYF